jgi:hypothetical protein
MRIRAIIVPPALAALLVAATVLSVAWAVFTTTFEAPDESAHVSYVQQLAETGHGPHVGLTAGHTLSSEAAALVRWQNLDAVVGLSAGRPGWSEAELEAWRRVQGDARRDDGSGPNPLAQNPPLYYLYETIPYRIGTGWSLPARMLLMRLANLPLLWVVIVCSWLALGELFRGRRFPQTVGTGAVALLPMVGFLSGVVNPEIALAAVTTAAIALALAALRLGPRPTMLLGLGALGALGVLLHGRGLALVPPIVLALALVLWRGRRTPGVGRGVAAGAGAVALMVVGLAIAIAYSNGHAGSTSFSGELTGSSTSGLDDLSGLFGYVWQFYFSPLVDMLPPPGEGPFGYRQVFVEQFLTGAFGSLEVRYATGVYQAAQIVQALALVALLAVVVRRWEQVRAHAAQAIVLLAFLASMLVLLHVAAWQDLSVPPNANLLVGRYLVPLVALFGIGVAIVVDALPRRGRVVLGSAVLATGAVLSVSGIALTAVRFYV